MSTKQIETDSVTAEKKEAKFSKEKLLSSKAYTDKKDLLNALLQDGMMYSKKEADKLIADYLKGSVK